MPSPHSILAPLNERQREAATTIQGPTLVIAGPGSGKTHALTHRIAYLIARGIPAETILAVTFTNKAAEEMRHRVATLLLGDGQNDEHDTSDENAPGRFHRAKRSTKRSDPATSPCISTFHSLAASILRRESNAIGYEPNFTIYDEGDSLALVKEIMKEQGVSSERIPPAMVAAIISNLKTDLIAWNEYEGREAPEPFPRTVARIYEAYQERLRTSNALDFDDLIFFLVRLFRDQPRILERWQARFRYLHVDEYQDTSVNQYELIRLLAGTHPNLFAIGDDAQAIYGWRRADYRNILNFERDWPDARVIFLEENYRSTPEILAVANRLIANNRSQKQKTLWTKNASGTLPTIRAHEDERREAEFIAGELTLLRRGGLEWRDSSVLYRTNAQSRAIEEAMIEHAIPYAIIGGVRFFERREVKDLLAYLRYLENPGDALALKRIVNVPARGIGPKTFLEYLSGRTDALGPRERVKIAGFEELMERLRRARETRTLAGFLRTLIRETGYEEYLADVSRDSTTRIENIRELVSLAQKYDPYPVREAATKLLQDMALMSGEDEFDAGDDRVKLMTLHAAKGLEFPVVFITGLEEGILPHAKSVSSGTSELEEERRLAYVGMTRAKEKLYLTWAISRRLFGELQVNMPSRFLKELPEELLTGRNEIPDDSEVYLVDES